MTYYREIPEEMTRFRWLWMRFLAGFRLSEYAVCVMSRGRGMADDFHDYPDDELGTPCHMTVLKCKRCGKQFTM